MPAVRWERRFPARWLGQGLSRVWKNRLHCTWLGAHEVEQFDQQPGESFRYPESQGLFAGVRWARLDTQGGALLVESGQADGYLRIGTPRISHVNTTIELPQGDCRGCMRSPRSARNSCRPMRWGRRRHGPPPAVNTAAA